MKPLYIFDLDSTLANASHRQPLLDNKEDPDRWRKFYAACLDDEPIGPTIRTMAMLAEYADIWIFSGRSDEVRIKTVHWLWRYTHFYPEMLDTALVMRPAGDTTADDDLKRQWLLSMLEEDRERLVATFDDRDRVVAMWRANGIQCFQVAPGNF